MLPILFDSFSIESTSGAKGRIGTISRCKKCKVNEARNAEYTLDLETTVNDPTANSIVSQRIIAAKANPFDPIQHFVIDRTERNLDGIVKATAKHVKEFACQFVSEGDVGRTDIPTTYNLTPTGVWNKLFAIGGGAPYILDACPFTFTSNITTKANFALGFNSPATLGSILGGEEGSILDLFSGEYKYDNYSISFLSSRGVSSKYALRYGQNISSAKQVEDSSKLYTHILPYCSVSRVDGQYIWLFAPLYEIPNSECRTKKVFVLDCSDAAEGYQVGMTGQHWEEVRTAITSYAKQYATSKGIGKTDVSIEVTTRSELDAMKQLGLCDTVKVVLDEFGLETTAKITSVTYDSLMERWDKMTVGTAPVKLSDIILNKRRYNL